MSLVPQAKITVPQVPPEMVVRAGLRADLDTAGRADATLVCAPPGYGKTMLLADWAHTSTGPTGPTPPGSAWTATTTTRNGCGPR